MESVADIKFKEIKVDDGSKTRFVLLKCPHCGFWNVEQFFVRTEVCRKCGTVFSIPKTTSEHIRKWISGIF